ncbi:glycoside hydrolase [Tilletiopsis washingtonensis]|uniref:Glycoside hydrolase n=1 Tax=Tilletiopsis washingtonensis TaxID=58919 RepID=A0A316Z844_9BASI|nr:glycoside hydrolase [Tilletiopsis washingtonensis]PWN97112.1 glycoside hydrolase [Tilletiopsis washingtonensis]
MRVSCLLLSAGLFGSALASAERAIDERSPELQRRQTTATPAPAVAANYTIDSLWTTLWNQTQFFAFSNPSIGFYPIDANHSALSSTANSTKNTPLQVGVQVLDHREFQLMSGTGGGITDAASIVMADVKANASDTYWEMINLAFNPSAEWKAKGGAGFNSVRVPLGACDFGFQPYTYDDTFDGSTDLNLTLFNVDRAPKIWQLLQDIISVQPELKTYYAAWSPPAWMKGRKDGNTFGGEIQPQFEDVYTTYLVRSMQDISKKGIPITRLSLGNEPFYEPNNYPGTGISNEQQARMGAALRSKLDAAGLQDTRILVLDHNWDLYKNPIEVFDLDNESFDGVAWHCYGGEPGNQEFFNDAYPGREVVMDECTRVTQFGAEPWENLRQNVKDLAILSTQYGSSAILVWNAILKSDSDGFTTPHLDRVCTNCLAPFLVYDNVTETQTLDSQNEESKPPSKKHKRAVPLGSRMPVDEAKQELLPRQDTTTPASTEIYAPYYKRTSDFATLGHLGAAIQPSGSSEDWGRRIGVNTTEDSLLGNARLLVQAFRRDNHDAAGNSLFSLVILQRNDHFLTGNYEDMEVHINFRNTVAVLKGLGVGAYTLSWVAPKHN